jgi:hypothetical protein
MSASPKKADEPASPKKEEPIIEANDDKAIKEQEEEDDADLKALKDRLQVLTD